VGPGRLTGRGQVIEMSGCGLADAAGSKRNGDGHRRNYFTKLCAREIKRGKRGYEFVFYTRKGTGKEEG